MWSTVKRGIPPDRPCKHLQTAKKSNKGGLAHEGKCGVITSDRFNDLSLV